MAKKKIRKLLKGLGVGAALLQNRRQNQANVEMDLPVAVMPSDRVKSLMTSDRAFTGKGYDDPIMRGGMGVKSGRRIPGIQVDGSPISPFGFLGLKKGGRVKKGFAKKKKQANKMRKK